MRSLPLVLTGGRFRLDPSHEITGILEELIETRNTLAHVDEPAVHLIGPSDQVKIEDNKIIASFQGRPNPWGMVKLEKVKTFQVAVDVYFNEVLFPESGEITEGTIVVPAKPLNP